MRSLGTLLLLLLAANTFGQTTVETAITYAGDQPLLMSRDGGTVRIDDRVVTDSAVRSAIDGLGGQALLVWTQEGGAVMAQRFDASGKGVGFALRIGTNAAGPVAVAAGTDRYLVTWPSAQGDLYATILKPSGDPLVPPMPVTKQGPTVLEIAAAATGNTFAITWHIWPPETTVLATVLDDLAMPSSMEPLVVTTDGTFPDVTSNGSGFYIAWGGMDVTGIHGRSLFPNGLLGNVQRLTSGDDRGPRVAWDGFAYTIAFAQFGHPRPGVSIWILAIRRFSAAGAYVESLELPSTLYMPRTWDVVAGDGRVTVAAPPLHTFAVGPLRKRSRTVRH